MLTPQHLKDYQRECVIHTLYNDHTMLWLQMGLGKTIVALTTIVDRMRAGQVNKTIIWGPLRVINSVWTTEAKKWTHTKHLKFSIISGTPQQRIRALFREADIYLINYENMNWLVETFIKYFIKNKKPIPFDMVIYDEISKLKNSQSVRMAGTKKVEEDKQGNTYEYKIPGWKPLIDQFKYRIGLTGTPAPNGYIDLFGQYLVIDNGERLGKYITHYRENYFQSDYNGWTYTTTELGRQAIEKKIFDITKKMDAKDYLKMPKCKEVDMMVKLPDSVVKQYKQLEKEMFTALDSGTEVEVFNRASLSNKCLQFCNGSPYISLETREFERLHDVKLHALEEVLEEAAGSPVLCSYTFKSDAERIMKHFKKYKPVNLTDTPAKLTQSVIDKWNNGQLKLIIGHPACLHPSTNVLTERRGWVKLTDVLNDEKVFDGVEFVSHGGCWYSGEKEVIDVFGITMTKNHKILIDNDWKEAQYVRDCEDTRRKALYQYKENDKYIGQMLEMQPIAGNTPSKCDKTQQNEKSLLSLLYKREISQYDWYTYLENMARFEKPSKRLQRQRLRRSRDNNGRKVGRFFKLLQRHVRRLFGQFNNRKDRCKRPVPQRKLYMGKYFRSTRKQTEQPFYDVQRKKSTPCRTMQNNWFQQNDVINEIKQGYDTGASCESVSVIAIRKKHEASECQKKRIEKVYDLVNCGPRHRFLIKNDKGECFISHNSMGHGIDGLQKFGSIIVWYGLNWSYELYEQFNGRINRQGQTKPVSIIRILCDNTVDLAVLDAINRKCSDQDSLKKAIDRYRNNVPVLKEFDFR